MQSALAFSDTGLPGPSVAMTPMDAAGGHLSHFRPDQLANARTNGSVHLDFLSHTLPWMVTFYFPSIRLVEKVLSTTAPDISDRVANGLDNFVARTSQHLPGRVASPVIETEMVTARQPKFEWQPSSSTLVNRALNSFVRPQDFLPPANSNSLESTPLSATRRDLYHKPAMKILSGIELAAFGSLALVNYLADRAILHRDCNAAFAAETGKADALHPLKVPLHESTNPIIAGELDRFRLLYRSRFGSAGFFAFGVQKGILAVSGTTFIERVVAYRPLAFDTLKSTVTDVQINNLQDDLTRQQLVVNLIKVMQEARLDHHLPPFPAEQMDALRPTLGKVADDIISRRFGFTDELYILGGGVLIPGKPLESQKNYEHFQEVGLDGITLEAQRRAKGGRGTWEGRVGATPPRQIAKSAELPSLLEQREQSSSRIGSVYANSAAAGKGSSYML